MSLKERNIIKEETENQKSFKELYAKVSTQDYLPEHMPIDSDVGRRVVGLVQTIEDRKLYKGKGGEIMRAAVCHLIKSLC